LSGKTLFTLISFLLFTLATATGVLVIYQNSLRMVKLSADFGVMAFELAEPVSVSALIGGSFGAGLVLGMVFVGYLWIRSHRRAVVDTPAAAAAEPEKW